ncbi:MAG: oligosaccharide repeat unit polymerase [Lachnospiraceae bacterium]|nr:oligosaccharide repeat unit polymerase [Lachnospiraceae bacterium]
MIYSIFAVFLILYFLAYLFQRSFIAPLSLLLLSFLMAVALIIINVNDWDVHINPEFVPYIFMAVASFSAGCLLVSFFSRAGAPHGKVSTKDYQRIALSEHYPATMLLVISGICTMVYIFMMLRNVGFSGGVRATLRAIYDEAVKRNNGGFILHQMHEIVIAIAEINFFQILSNKYLKKRRTSAVKLFVPVMFFAICMIVSTDRNIFIRFVLYCLCMWVLFYTYTSKKTRQKTNWRILKKALLYAVIMLLLFYALGKLKNYTSNFSRMVGIYGGSGLYNFNLFIGEFDGSNLAHGNSTFSELQNTLKALGLLGGNIDVKPIGDEFIVYRTSTGYVYASNIYSAMRVYVEDFGFAGVIIFPMFLGIVFEVLYKRTKNQRFGFSWILYSMMIYSIVYFTVLEQFFKRFHLGMVYEIGWVFLLYILIYGRINLRFKSVTISG